MEILNCVKSLNEQSLNQSEPNKFIQNSDINLLSFFIFYSGPIHIIIDAVDKNLHFGKLHSMKVGKLLHNQAHGIVEIKPIGARIRVTFGTTVNIFKHSFIVWPKGHNSFFANIQLRCHSNGLFYFGNRLF